MASEDIVHKAMTVDGANLVVQAAITNATFKEILQRLIPEFEEHQARKSLEYGDTAGDLGAAGQYADMHRKMRKLKRQLWDRETSEYNTEPVREVLLDMIGHCFLTIRFLEAESHVKGETRIYAGEKLLKETDCF